MSSKRRCFDCGATSTEAAFPARRRRAGEHGRCLECAKDPAGAGAAARVAARRAEIAALRAAKKFRAAKPFYTAPLFAALRPESRQGGK